jgi:SNF2 family DNA or RNA helicase
MQKLVTLQAFAEKHGITLESLEIVLKPDLLEPNVILSDENFSKHLKKRLVKTKYLDVCRLQQEWVSSSKIDRLMEILVKCRDECPNDKSIGKSVHENNEIVFSQFVGYLDMLEIPLVKAKIGFVRVS